MKIGRRNGNKVWNVRTRKGDTKREVVVKADPVGVDPDPTVEIKKKTDPSVKKITQNLKIALTKQINQFKPKIIQY